MPVPVAALSKAWVCGRSSVEIVGSNPTGAWISVYCDCCVLSCRGLCDELITSPGASYRMWCVAVCDLESSWMRRAWPSGVCRAKNKQARRSSQISSHFLKVIITAIVCLAAVTDCQTSPTRDERRKAGGESGRGFRSSRNTNMLYKFCYWIFYMVAPYVEDTQVQACTHTQTHTHAHTRTHTHTHVLFQNTPGTHFC